MNNETITETKTVISGGLMDVSNCLMTSSKFKKVGYNEDVQIRNTPDLVFNVVIILDGCLLLQTIKDLSHFSEAVKFCFNKEGDGEELRLYSEGLGKAERTLSTVCTPESKPSKCKYSIEFLKACLSQFDKHQLNQLTLKFSSDYPLRGECAGEWFIIAPRVDND